MSNFFGVFEISASGMDAERLRLQAATTNIANASSVRTPGGALYQPLRVVTHPVSEGAFSAALHGQQSLQPVAAEMVPAGNGSRQVYDPDHPYADKNGFIQQTAVDPVFEMSQVMLAVRAYEANVKAFSAAHAMMQQALRVGEQS
jgi:flagellar basal-body rod protein FlgC